MLFSKKVLVLNQSYCPLSVCDAKKAIFLVFSEKAKIVSSDDQCLIRTVSESFPLPLVVRLSKYVHVPFRKVILSRRFLLKRDNYTCQYCGKKDENLTIDHVLPKAKGGNDTWENLVVACVKCNNLKANQTPKEANMKLIKMPMRPSYIFFMQLNSPSIPESWKPYLFMI